ncbi:DUF296 domain-containing protein [Rhizobium sp. SSA_523]|nr:DUF296 domain-containing protein [Rhizobium sp. SSA_523]WKC22078.1 DUF296 domain-containing protein [Rhizobium sp. SSA_523]
MRSIRHPGPVTNERTRAIACRAHALTLTLKPDRDINSSVANAFVEQGFEGGYIWLREVSMDVMRFVKPAASSDASHAAWYSETFAMQGAMILEAGLHAGTRDDQPFLHCHGTWRDADGHVDMGHLLPFEARLRQECQVQAIALDGALLVARPDPETNFTLFTPEPRPASPLRGGARAVLATVRPNADLCLSLEAICSQHGIATATVHGIGSLVGADYEDGTSLSAHASELYIRDGQVVSRQGQPRAMIDIAMIDLTDRQSAGRLKRGLNPVCVTAELLIVESRAEA